MRRRAAPGGSRACGLLEPGAAVAAALAVGAALALVVDPRLVAAVALPLAGLAVVAVVLRSVVARRAGHTGAGWGACPACAARAGTGAALVRVLSGDRETAASLAVVGLSRFSSAEGLRPALQCELLAAVEAAAGREAVYVLPGDRLALLSDRPADELRVALVAAAGRANRGLDGACVGVGLVACGRAGLSRAFERADAEMRRAASGGTGAVAIAPPRPRQAPVTQEAVGAVRGLISDPAAIAVAYQPIVELSSGRTLGYEALMRPRPPVGEGQGRGSARRAAKLDSPALAFEIAGQVGLAAALDRACRDAVLADAPGLDMRRSQLLFVNVAPGALAVGDLDPDALLATVQEAGLSPGQVVLEVREGDGADPTDLAAEGARLRAAGFRLALDNVGSGQSRLETLWRCPVDYLKLDQALTQQASRERAALGVFQSLCALARQLGSALVAEGVENERVLRFVRTIEGRKLEPLAVQAVQGYGLGKPGPRPQPAGTPDQAAGGAPATEEPAPSGSG